MENYRLKLLLKCPSEEVVNMVQRTLGFFFQQATHRWKCNVHIAVMILPWGLELRIAEDGIHWLDCGGGAWFCSLCVVAQH
ncbi:hypothetical protein SUGI_0698950, partial [Cryptomeria japonica]